MTTESYCVTVIVPTNPGYSDGGWIEQWYGNVPVDEKVIWNVPPEGLRGPLFQTPISLVVV